VNGRAHRRLRAGSGVFRGLVCVVLAIATTTASAADIGAGEYRRLQRAEEALRDARYEQVLTAVDALLSPETAALARAIAHQLAAEASIALDRADAALAHLDAARRTGALDPAQTRFVAARMGYIELAAERFEAAAAHLDRAIDPERPDAELVTLAALAEARAGRCEVALARLSGNVTPPAPDARTWFEIEALCRIELGLLDEAAKSLHRLIDLVPSEPGYWRQLIAVLQRAERYRDASAAYGAAREIVPLDGADVVNYARLLVYTGRPLEGARVLQAGLEDGRVPETAEHLEALADAYVIAREAVRAYPVLERLARLGESSGAAYVTLADTALRFGDFERAVEGYRRALEAARPDDRPARQLALGIAAVYAGHETLALDTFAGIDADTPEGRRAEAWRRHLERRADTD